MEWKKLKLKEATLNSIKSLTIHGFPNIFRANHILIKIWWFFLTICSIGFSIHFITQTLIEYFSYLVTTQVNLRDNLGFINFPVVSICNSNKLSTSNASPYLKYLFSNYSANENESTIEIIQMLKWKEADELFEFLNITMENRQNISNSIKDMLIDCKFTDTYCSLKDFEWIFNRKYGNCYRFNSISKPKIVYEIDSYHGLTMVLNLSQSKEIDSLDISKGFYLSIDDRRINVYDNFDDVIFVESGLETSVMMDKATFYKKPLPYSACELESEDNYESYYYINQLIKANYSYSKSYCLEFCVQDQILSECNCTLPKNSIKLPRLNYCPMNVNSNEYICAKENENNKAFHSKCKIECPLECKRNKFISYVTTKKFDSDIMKYLNKSSNKNDLIILKIYFGSISDIEYKQSVAMSKYNLISNIGGTLGIFLGKILKD